MLNHALTGKRYPAIRFAVDAARIREFAAAIGDDDPAYAGEDPIAPPTFAIAAQIDAIELLTADPDLGLDFREVLHGEQEFEWVRPIRAGDRLIAEPEIAEIRGRPPLEFLVLNATFADDQGAKVVAAKTTLIVRARR